MEKIKISRKLNSILVFGVVANFIYWFLPIFNDIHYDNYLERTDDFYGLLYFPVLLFQGTSMISQTFSYFTQLGCFTATLLLFYIIFRIFKRTTI